MSLDEVGLPLPVERVQRTREQRLANALATAIGAAKLVERARTGNPAESASNAGCAAMWLRVAAAELDELVKPAE